MFSLLILFLNLHLMLLNEPINYNIINFSINYRNNIIISLSLKIT